MNTVLYHKNMRTKICTKCEKRKEINEFSFKSKSREIRRADCKECFKELTQKHYKENKASYKEVGKRRREASRIYILDYLSNKECIDCGTNDIRVLEFDHLDNKEYEISVLVTRGYSIETIEKELSKCVIRCKNCHAIKTAIDRNNYRHQKWLKINGVVA